MAGKVTTLSFGIAPSSRPPPPVLVRLYNGHNEIARRGGSMTQVELDRCSCCPYGYHIDRDFVPFTKNMLSREADADKLQELRSKLRSQRKSMDKLLGVPLGKSDNWKFETLSRASVDVWRLRNSEERDIDIQIDHEDQIPVKKLARSYSNHNKESTQGDECCLQAAVQDFENCLTRTRPGTGRYLSFDVPDTSKFHTFPRLRSTAVGSKSGDADGLENLFKNQNYREEQENLSLPVNITNGNVFSPTWANGVESKPSTTLSFSNGQSELASRVRELEEQLKIIPELQVKVTLLAEEKRQVMKLLDSEKRKRASMEEMVDKLSQKNIFDRRDTGDVNQNSMPSELLKDAMRAVVTRDVGSSPVNIPTRSVGVGEEIGGERSTYRRCDSYSPTGSLAGTKRRRVRSFDTGVQVTESDLGIKAKDPVLQINETIDAGVQVQMDLAISEKRLVATTVTKVKHVGVSAKPRMLDVGISSKPKYRDFGVNPSSMLRLTKSVGVMVRLEIESERNSESVTQVGNDLNTPSNKVTPVTQENNLSNYYNLAKEVVLKDSSHRESAHPTNVSKTTSEEQIPVKKVPVANEVIAQSHSDSAHVANSGNSSEVKPPSRIPRLSTPSTSPASSPKTETSPISSLFVPSISELSRDDTAKVRTESLFSVEKKSLRISNEESRKTNEHGNSDTSDEENLPQSQDTEYVESIQESAVAKSPVPHEKKPPGKELLGALKVLNDALLRGRTTKQVTAAISIILREWFQIAGTKSASPADVEDYLDMFEGFSPQLLRYIVNMPDGNGNTAMHYAVSHGNFDVVSILLDSKVCDPNKANKAGYTSVMLVSLAKVLSDTHRQVVRRLFSLGDVNIKAAQHGQTALMLAASHGRLDTVRLLLEAGADINIRDEDGSTALMCASEHGHGDIVKYLLSQADCDPHITDNDGSNALGVAMEAGHKDIGVMLYAHMHFVAPNNPGNSPTNSRGKKSRNGSLTSTPYNGSPVTTGNNSPTSPTHKTPK